MLVCVSTKYDVFGVAVLLYLYRNTGRALEFNDGYPFKMKRLYTHLAVAMSIVKFRENIPIGVPSGFREGDDSRDKFAAKAIIKKYPGIK